MQRPSHEGPPRYARGRPAFIMLAVLFGSALLASPAFAHGSMKKLGVSSALS